MRAKASRTRRGRPAARTAAYGLWPNASGRERRAQRVAAEVAQREEQAADGGQVLRVGLAHPVGLVAARGEVLQRLAEDRQPRRPQDDGAGAGDARQGVQVVRQGGQLPHGQHVVDRHLRVAVALRARRRDGMGDGRHVGLGEVEAGQHDGLAVEVPRDVDAGVDHHQSRLSARTAPHLIPVAIVRAS